MKKRTRFSGKVTFICMMFMLAAAPVFSADTSLGDLKNVMEEFSESMAKSLPFNSTIGLNWSDAHIKKFPHFGAGLALGFVTMDNESLEKLMKQFDISLPVELNGFGKFPMFGYSVEGRLGGFILPFDIGVKFGILPIPTGDVRLDYTMFGFDFRYAIVEQGVLKPAISVGAGFNYLSGGIARSIGDDRTFQYPNAASGTSTLILKAPTVGINWETASIDLKAQISKEILFIITPYAGFGASVGFSKAGYSVETTVEDSENNIEAAKAIAKQFGIADLGSNGFSSEEEFNGWSYRVFGGISFNAAILKIDLTGLYNFVDKNYGVTLGLRVQL